MRERAAAMRTRVLNRLAEEVLSRADIDFVDSQLAPRLAARDTRLEDDHDIDALHPARSILILLDVARIAEPAVLAAAAATDSFRSDLEPPEVRPAASTRLPTPLSHPDPADLLEAVIGLDPPIVAAVLAERLDHARHLHLRDRALWQPQLLLEEEVYLPIVRRVGGPLQRRYDRWYSSFSARIRRVS